MGRGAALRLAMGEKHIGQRHQQDVVVDGGALCGDLALEEGGQKGV